MREISSTSFEKRRRFKERNGFSSSSKSSKSISSGFVEKAEASESQVDESEMDKGWIRKEETSRVLSGGR